eukprot:GHVS01029472.1.p1 GENE.GHVS01029472.1~~GHVS01029472.1.p1  ORF type:complete len:216 (+),score=42.01 GHVS01029472.1:42-689(+)
MTYMSANIRHIIATTNLYSVHIAPTTSTTTTSTTNLLDSVHTAPTTTTTTNLYSVHTAPTTTTTTTTTTMASHQDWNTVTWSKSNSRDKNMTKEQEVNVARRKGESIDTEKKFLGGQNKAAKNICPNAAKVDEDTGDYHVDRVTHDFAKALQQARLDKKMTQAQLAQAVNEKTSVINDYEAGRAIPNGQLVGKLKRILGAQLPAAKPRTVKPTPP